MTAIIIYFVYFFRVLLLLNESSVAGKTAGFVVTLGMTVTHGLLYQTEYEHQAVEGGWSRTADANVVLPCNFMIAFAFPVIFATSYIFSEGLGSVKKGTKVASVLFVVGILESAALYMTNSHIFFKFFRPGTDEIIKFAIRMGTPLVLKGVFIECGAVWAPLLSNMLGTELHSVSVALFCPVGCVADLIGRLMQSSGK
ncbi:hypothetical protein TrRE_jg12315 [Triparma retinervis]|uniref:Uncharacterized protein n=1 Tax=Triparma retinervis TaxID=2557542 RepID=A0A9W6ZMB5_9STRA|nr:hypothetical protein TrRE_jg12315 [Triparma retinervis]